jgi:hypothetical protein
LNATAIDASRAGLLQPRMRLNVLAWRLRMMVTFISIIGRIVAIARAKSRPSAIRVGYWVTLQRRG